jgi:hypothetical protein
MQIDELTFQSGVAVYKTEQKLIQITLAELKQSISVGKYQGLSFLETINSIRTSGYKSATAQKLKPKLPFFVPSVHLRDDKIGNEPVLHLGLVGIDLDFPELFNRDERMRKVYEAKKKIANDPYVLLAFYSPQFGLKIFPKVPPSLKNHDRVHHKVAHYFANKYGFEHDRGANGLKKLCFLSYDPEPIFNPHCLTFDPIDFEYGDSAVDDDVSVTELKEQPKKLEAKQTSELSQQSLDEQLKLDIHFAVDFITQNKTDITVIESDWFRLGHAFASLGEIGREYFHTISQFYPRYSRKQCDEQFDYCLNTGDGRIKIGTFFYIAKKYSVPLRKKDYSSNEFKEAISHSSILEELPSLDPQIYDQLPPPLGELCKLFPAGRRRDILLLAMITVLAPIFNKVYGLFFGKKVIPILFTMVLAPPASGKSIATWAKKLGTFVDGYLQGLYQTELETHVANNGKEPDKPIPLMLFIPGNSSQAGILQIFSRLESGVIFETESDIISAIFSTDFGNYSPILRALYEQEESSSYRKTGKEHLKIQDSAISVFLTGTPSQLPHLIKGGADGLYSRFNLYGFAEKPKYLSPFRSVPEDLSDHFDQAGRLIFDIYNRMRSSKESIFKFTSSQMDVFEKQNEEWQAQADNSHGKDGVSVVNRLGQIIFRISMVLTVLRTKFHGDQICHDFDFDTAMKIGDTLRIHSLGILTTFPEPAKMVTFEGKTIDRFLQSLPRSFTYAEAVAQHKEFGITDRSAKRYISLLEKDGRIVKDYRGAYTKRG